MTAGEGGGGGGGGGRRKTGKQQNLSATHRSSDPDQVSEFRARVTNSQTETETGARSYKIRESAERDESTRRHNKKEKLKKKN